MSSSQSQSRWPGGAKTVVGVTVHVDGPCVEVGKGLLPLGIHSGGRYSIQRGVHKYLDLLAKHGIKATFFVCGWDTEHWPALVRDMHAAGHEVAAHGYQHEAWDLGAAEPELLEKTHRAIIDAIGVAPVGWCSPSGRKSALTIPTLRRLGYLYDASEKDLDAPYLLETADGTRDDFIMLPNNTVSLDDAPVYNMGQALTSEMYDGWVAEFDALHAGTGYVHFTCHPRGANGSGTPARAATVDRFLSYAKQFDGVRFVTLKELARHCLQEPARWRMPRVLGMEAA